MDSLQELIERDLTSDSDTKRVEIILLTFNNPRVETKCLEYLIKYTKHPYKLTVYDNSPNLANMSKIWNKLVRESTCDYIVIMDTDAYVEEGWLTQLMKTIDHKDVMVAAPILGNDRIKTPHQSMTKTDGPSIEGTEDVSGYCYLFKKEVFEEVGHFDERFYLFGQETEFFRRILKAGYKIYIDTSVVVEHEGSATIKENVDNNFLEEDTTNAHDLLGFNDK